MRYFEDLDASQVADSGGVAGICYRMMCTNESTEVTVLLTKS